MFTFFATIAAMAAATTSTTTGRRNIFGAQSSGIIVKTHEQQALISLSFISGIPYFSLLGTFFYHLVFRRLRSPLLLLRLVLALAFDPSLSLSLSLSVSQNINMRWSSPLQLSRCFNPTTTKKTILFALQRTAVKSLILKHQQITLLQTLISNLFRSRCFTKTMQWQFQKQNYVK